MCGDIPELFREGSPADCIGDCMCLRDIAAGSHSLWHRFEEEGRAVLWILCVRHDPDASVL